VTFIGDRPPGFLATPLHRFGHDRVDLVGIGQFDGDVQLTEPPANLLPPFVHLPCGMVHRVRIAHTLDHVFHGLLNLGQLSGGNSR